jgi:hypothetical protein
MKHVRRVAGGNYRIDQGRKEHAMAESTSRPKVNRTVCGGWLDHIRTAIFALQLASELTNDEAEIEHIQRVISQLQKRLAEHARRRDAALFATTELQHVARPERTKGAPA